MILNDALRNLPDSAQFYNADVGVVSLGELRAVPVADRDADTLAMWAEIATRNYSTRPCPRDTGATPLARKASIA